MEWPDVKKPWITRISIFTGTIPALEIVTFALNHMQYGLSKP
jgi:hypothetical protein